MFSCVVEREGLSKQISLACVGSVCTVWTTVGLPQSKTACASWVYNAQASWSSARTLSQVGPAFYVLPRSKLFRFLGTPQGHRPDWAVRFVPFPGPSSSGDQVIGECTLPGGPCVLITSPVPAAQFPRDAASTPSQVCCVSPLGH